MIKFNLLKKVCAVALFGTFSLSATAFDVKEATIADMQAAMSSGELTSHELVQLYLARIDQYDKQGPKLNTVFEANPDALAIADKLDAERKRKGARGALHGIPVLVKANIGTHDKMTTTAGSLALAGSIPKKDAVVVDRLRKAGAVILGKTNMTELAGFMATQKMPGGYSSLGGQVLNPYGPDIPVCGSSSGSAAAVAANLTAVAIGTDTDGSIICPTLNNSVVGIRPTMGLASRTGIIPVGRKQDIAGPIARTVTDASILLGSIASIDINDPVTFTSKSKTPDNNDYSKFLKTDALQGKRIGIVNRIFGQSLELDKGMPPFMEKTVEALTSLGASTELVGLGDENFNSLTLITSIKKVSLYQFKADMNNYLRNAGGTTPVSSLKGIIDYNKTHADTALRYGQDLLVAAQSNKISKEDFNSHFNSLVSLARSTINNVMIEKNLDALLFVSDTGELLSSYAGYPSITVPAGYMDEKPVGVAFLAEAFSEPKLVGFAYAYEQATKSRQAPACCQ